MNYKTLQQLIDLYETKQATEHDVLALRVIIAHMLLKTTRSGSNPCLKLYTIVKALEVDTNLSIAVFKNDCPYYAQVMVSDDLKEFRFEGKKTEFKAVRDNLLKTRLYGFQLEQQ